MPNSLSLYLKQADGDLLVTIDATADRYHLRRSDVVRAALRYAFKVENRLQFVDYLAG